MFDVELAEDSKSKNRFHTKQGGVYIASGVLGSLTGLGANILLIDDPIKNREEADSQGQRDKIWDWYTSTALTRLEKDGAIILIQTRWHEDDLAGRLLAQGGWEHLDLPAIAIEDEPNREKGEALWTEKYDLEALNRIRTSVSARDWWSLFQQRPTVQENGLFQPDWFRYWDELPDDLFYVTLVDSAFTQKESSDYSVVTTIGIKDSKWYICEYVRGKWNPADLIDKICGQIKKWNPVTVGVETIAAQTVIGFYLKEKMEELEMYSQIQEIKQRSSKEVKIQRLVPKMRDGKIVHHRSMLELEAEFLAFPSGKHDDIIDTIQMCDELKVVNTTKIKQPPEGLEFLEEMNLAYNSFGEPM
jgi:predicted phage terminase large subunit-like protein